MGPEGDKNDPFCWRPLNFTEEDNFIEEASYI